VVFALLSLLPAGGDGVGEPVYWRRPGIQPEARGVARWASMCVAAPTPPSRPAGPPILPRTPAAARGHTTGPMA